MIFYFLNRPDFKVNAMDEDELRKSVRRQKFEKQGLTLPTSQSGTNTGTGTSDDEEDSTPSADLAERSLASTLAESTEQLAPLQSQSSFMQAALDGPGGFPERNDRSKCILIEILINRKVLIRVFQLFR